MHIFLDESGAFIPPPAGRPKVSAVVALVIPSHLCDEISREFRSLRASWGQDVDEAKGSAATPAQVAQVINLLGRYESVFAEACVIDTGNHTVEDVRLLRTAQAETIEVAVTPGHHPAMRDEVTKLAERVRELPEQLLLQMFPMILVIERVIRSALIFHAVRIPAELGEFHWVVDAKDHKVTAFEDLWKTLMAPFLNAIFLRNPADLIETGDYSHYSNFDADLEKLAPEVKESLRGERVPTDLNRMMRDFAFRASREDDCLQIVDILAAALTRALNQSLDSAGWTGLGALFIRRRTGHSVQMILMSADVGRRGQTITARNYHGHVMERLDAKAKSMLP